MNQRPLLFITLATFVCASWASAQTPVFDFTIPRISSPRIDGDLSDLAWTEASQLGGKVVIDLDNAGYSRVARPRVAYLGYDNTALYFAFIDYSPNPAKLASNDKAFWQGDSIEIYAQWDRSNPNAYIQFGITPSGYIELRPADEKPRSKTDLLVAIKKTEFCWYTEVAIPFALFEVKPPKAGDVWGLNLCGRQAAFRTSSTGNLTWCPPYGGFGAPSRFAKLRFEN
ncbi:MAG: hypothetical protein HY360_10445 [Verrucomicrobia bacterium]|nr:hypothetical protein [Verrucomicrobiota bacterium]